MLLLLLLLLHHHLQAADANVESQRSLTWSEAMKAGAAAVPPKVDDVYTDPGPGPDIHQLAAAVRSKREEVSQLQQQWNDLVQVGRAAVVGRRQCWGLLHAGRLSEQQAARTTRSLPRAPLHTTTTTITTNDSAVRRSQSCGRCVRGSTLRAPSSRCGRASS
jgi:hypothetical protein